MRPITFLLRGWLLSMVLVLPTGAQEASLLPPTLAVDAAPVDVGTAQLPDARQPEGPPALTRGDLEAWLDGYLPYALDNGDIAGAVVVVVRDGEVLLQKGYGYADLDTRAPVDPDATLFRPGSVSKLFTWTAVMQLVEQGRLDLDADLNQYIDFEIPPTAGVPITLRQVLTHTTGMEEQIRGLISPRTEEIVTLEAALKRWVPERIHAPGTTPAYSNYATALAGYIVQRVSGEPFDEYIDNHIFQPLGMARSSFSQPLQPDLLAGMSKGYLKASDGEARDYEFISLAPAGSLAATGADMGRFMIAHLQGGQYGGARILEEQTARLMHTTGQASVGPLNRMMLGFYETTINGRRAIAHGGDTMYFHSDLQLFLDEGIGIFVSMNSSGRDGATGIIRSTLVRGFADRYLPGPEAAAVDFDPEQAAEHARQIAGTYESSRRPQSNLLSLVNVLGPVKVMANEDGTISVPLAMGANGVPKKWREISPYLWQDVSSGERLAAEVVDGKVTRFSMEPYGAIMVFDRVSAWRALSMPLMVASLAILLLTVLAWPVSALVRRRYGVRHGLVPRDARALRVARLVSLAVLLSVGGTLAFLVAMLGNLEMTGPGSDKWINLLRLFATVVLPVGAALSVWSAWQTLKGGRKWLAKLWAVLVALACLFLLWLGLAHNLLGYGAYY